jgi:hypothetical protein
MRRRFVSRLGRRERRRHARLLFPRPSRRRYITLWWAATAGHAIPSSRQRQPDCISGVGRNDRLVWSGLVWSGLGSSRLGSSRLVSSRLGSTSAPRVPSLHFAYAGASTASLRLDTRLRACSHCAGLLGQATVDDKSIKGLRPASRAPSNARAASQPRHGLTRLHGAPRRSWGTPRAVSQAPARPARRPGLAFPHARTHTHAHARACTRDGAPSR